MVADVIAWLREICADYTWEAQAVFRTPQNPQWPLKAGDAKQLERQLAEFGSFLPLPSEPAALANIVEVSLVDYLLRRLAEEPGVVARRGTDRIYPDLELTGQAFDGKTHAVDVKVAQLERTKKGNLCKNTKSRITLYKVRHGAARGGPNRC